MKPLLLSADGAAMDIAGYLFFGVVAVLLNAGILRWIFDVSKFRKGQQQIEKTLQMILEELRAGKGEQDYPQVSMPASTGNAIKDQQIATQIQKAKRAFKLGELSSAEYVATIEDLKASNIF